MFTTCLTGGVLRWWSVLLAILALSPLPLARPSGVGLAAIGLIGTAVLLCQSRMFPLAALRQIGVIGVVGLIGGHRRLSHPPIRPGCQFGARA